MKDQRGQNADREQNRETDRTFAHVLLPNVNSPPRAQRVVL